MDVEEPIEIKDLLDNYMCDVEENKLRFGDYNDKYLKSCWVPDVLQELKFTLTYLP